MTYASAVLADAPAVFWEMQETSGTVVTDTSGNARHSVYQNAPTLGAASLVPNDAALKSVNFDGSVDSANWSDTTTTRASTWTVSGWVKPNSASYSEGQFWGSNYDSNNVNMSLRVNGSKFIAAFFGGGVGGAWHEAIASSNFASGTVYHVAITYDGTTLRLYVNSVLDASLTIAGASFTGSTIANFYVAQKWDAGARTAMNASHVAIWTSALSGGQIATHFAAGGGVLPTTAALSQTSTLSAAGVRGKAGTAALTQTSVLSAHVAATLSGAAALTQTSTLTAAAGVAAPLNVPLGPWVADLSRSAGFTLDTRITLSVLEADDPLEALVAPRQRVSEEYPDPVLVDGRPT